MIQPALKDDAFLADVKCAALDLEHLHLWWLGQSGFLVQWQNHHLLLDPYLSDSLTKKYAGTDKPHVRMTELIVAPERLDFIDVVTSSHNHTDHLDAETLIPLMRASPNLVLVIPEANRGFVADRLKVNTDFPLGLDAGTCCEWEGGKLADATVSELRNGSINRLSPSPDLRAPSPPPGERDGVRGCGSMEASTIPESRFGAMNHVTQPSPAASSGGVSPPGEASSETLGKLAGGTPALLGSSTVQNPPASPLRTSHFTLRISAVPAAHNELEKDEQGRHRFLGYVVEFGPWTIYHSGDTIHYPSMEDWLRPWRIDVALLPINGDRPERRAAGNLDGRETATLAKNVGARLVIPCHYDMFEFNTASPEEFENVARELGQPFRILQCAARWSSHDFR